MRTLTLGHMDKLDAIYLEEYLDVCVQDLIDIDFSNPFPANAEDYKKFVTHVYGVAKKYGLDNEKYAFAFILAWHVRGERFVQEKRVIELLNSQTVDSHTKYQYLMKIAIETMEAYENQEGEEDGK
ncbi:MAG: hypothetical protein GQ531_04260 [Sulfurovum sp.]|nr:hypothetical protein [Sulfurovum sp.]